MTARKLAVAVVIVLTLAGIVMLARLWEPHDVSRHDPVYWLAIPQVMKSVLLFEACAPARYSLVRQDGPKPRFATVRYGTTLSRQDLLSKYRTAFGDAGCVTEFRNSVLWARSCAHPFDHVEFDVAMAGFDAAAGCSPVTVNVIGG